MRAHRRLSRVTFYLDFEAYRRGDPDTRSATTDVARLLGELRAEKVDGIVVDLRGNGGGSLTEAIQLTGLFIDTGPVVQVREARGRVSVEGDRQLSPTGSKEPPMIAVMEPVGGC